MQETYTVSLVCVFCDTPLQGKEDKEYKSGDLIKCSECGEYNDYDSVFEIAKEKGVKQVEEDAMKEIEKALKGLG